MVVIEPDYIAMHELTGRFSNARLKYEAPVMLVFLPITKVFDEPPRVLRAASDLCTRAGIPEVRLNAFPEDRDLVSGEKVAETHRPVTLKVSNFLRSRSKWARSILRAHSYDLPIVQPQITLSDSIALIDNLEQLLESIVHMHLLMTMEQRQASSLRSEVSVQSTVAIEHYDIFPNP
jgi:hypothetical protein